MKWTKVFTAKKGSFYVTDPYFTTSIGHAFVEAGAKIGIPKNRDYNGAEQQGIGHFSIYDQKWKTPECCCSLFEASFEKKEFDCN